MWIGDLIKHLKGTPPYRFPNSSRDLSVHKVITNSRASRYWKEDVGERYLLRTWGQPYGPYS